MQFVRAVAALGTSVVMPVPHGVHVPTPAEDETQLGWYSPLGHAATWPMVFR